MAEEKKKIGKFIDKVSEDRDWVTRINGELGSGKKWDSQWGYLTGGIFLFHYRIQPIKNRHEAFNK